MKKYKINLNIKTILLNLQLEKVIQNQYNNLKYRKLTICSIGHINARYLSKNKIKSKIIKVMNIPENLKYTDNHEWIKVDGDIATVGITDYAQKELGDVVFVEVETIGEELSAGDTFGTIEAVKTVADIFTPVSGEVLEFNENLEDEPELINSAPYEGGWIIKVKLSDASELNGLMSADEYKAKTEA